MANASEQSAVTARTGKPFTFTRTRIVSTVTTTAEFFPGAGSTLRFANRDTDTLNAVGIPAGLLQAGDSVTVKYLNTTVFQGTVERIVDRHGRGDDRVQDVTCQGPWGRMNRLVFRQQWGVGTAMFSSSRVILNQTPGGLAQNMAAQLGEIVTFAAAKCGFAAGTIQADTLVLPADEARDDPDVAVTDWASWRPTQEATLLFAVRDDGAMLFIRKKRGLGAGLYNGPGGRLEPGETPLQAAIRETREEVCLDVRSAVRAGTLRFDFADGYRLTGHVFLSRDWSGEPQATDEADPVWFRPGDIPYDRMWKDDALWMPRMLEGRYFDGTFCFDGQRMRYHRVATSPAGVKLC